MSPGTRAATPLGIAPLGPGAPRVPPGGGVSRPERPRTVPGRVGVPATHRPVLPTSSRRRGTRRRPLTAKVKQSWARGAHPAVRPRGGPGPAPPPRPARTAGRAPPAAPRGAGPGPAGGAGALGPTHLRPPWRTRAAPRQAASASAPRAAGPHAAPAPAPAAAPAPAPAPASPPPSGAAISCFPSHGGERGRGRAGGGARGARGAGRGGAWERGRWTPGPRARGGGRR